MTKMPKSAAAKASPRSLFGLGNLYILINPDKLALQDKMTRSEVVVLSVEANQMRTWHGLN